jgi:type I restriction enzyme R subunit
MFFTSKEAAEITGCSLRQLQYWREKRVVVPTVDATGKGRSVFYAKDDLVSASVMGYLLSAGLDFQEARAGLKALKEKEPEFYKTNCASRYMLSRHSSDLPLSLMTFEEEDIYDCLKMGQPIIPIWLDEIHKQLGLSLNKLERFRQDYQI